MANTYEDFAMSAVKKYISECRGGQLRIDDPIWQGMRGIIDNIATMGRVIHENEREISELKAKIRKLEGN